MWVFYNKWNKNVLTGRHQFCQMFTFHTSKFSHVLTPFYTVYWAALVFTKQLFTVAMWYYFHFLFSIFKITIEPTEEDLKCFNDYETEMKCSLSTDRLKSCSGYKLNITPGGLNM